MLQLFAEACGKGDSWQTLMLDLAVYLLFAVAAVLLACAVTCTPRK